jgi:hypothetical protein
MVSVASILGRLTPWRVLSAIAHHGGDADHGSTQGTTRGRRSLARWREFITSTILFKVFDAQKSAARNAR